VQNLPSISNGEYPRVSIIILNWNGLQDTMECLESLKKITYPNYEVIVVDNGSDGEDPGILRERFGDYVRVIENDQNYGFSEGNNIGIRDALKRRTDYVLLLNNDTTVDMDFLTELVLVGESHSQIGLLGPKIYFYREPTRIWFAGGKISLRSPNSNRGQGQIDKGQFDQVICVDFLSGSCMIIRRNVLESVGLLDPIYFFGLEDIDISLRATQAGFCNVFVPASRIWHKVYRSGVKNRNIPYYTSRNSLILARKHHGAFEKVAIRTLAGVITEMVILSIRYRSPDVLMMMVKGLRDGLTLRIDSSDPGT
jgi:GT2 family glycosyltransferase